MDNTLQLTREMEEIMMSRKAFLIWGLVIISFDPIARAIVTFLGLSDIIPHSESSAFMNQAALYLAATYLLFIPLVFGTVLHLRFKAIGRRKRVLVLFMTLFIFSLPLPNILITLYDDYIIQESGAMTRFTAAMVESSKQNPHHSSSPWTFKHVMEYVLIHLPTYYIGQIGLFALLAFGCLDPRKPSKNRVVQFLKTGLQVKGRPKVMKPIKLAEA